MFTVPASAKANERRGHQEVGADILMHAGLEVAIARENASGNEIVLGDGFFQSGMKRAGIADTCRAAVAGGLGHFGRFSGPGDPFLLSSVEYFRMADIFGPSRHRPT
jgi:hypothetical protein